MQKWAPPFLFLLCVMVSLVSMIVATQVPVGAQGPEPTRPPTASPTPTPMPPLPLPTPTLPEVIQATLSSGFGVLANGAFVVIGLGVVAVFIWWIIGSLSSPSAASAGSNPPAAPVLQVPVSPLPSALGTGTVLQNRYQIVRQLGAGGMGAVYLAQHLGLGGKAVALKQNLGSDARQFQTEAVILANLNHPNLPRVLDHFLEPTGAQYLVMDYVEGQDLDTMVRQQGPLAENTVLSWMRQVLIAVKYLHFNRIIHRDIKPHNIIITPQGRATLVDFGISKVMSSGQPTLTGAKAGSPGYAPPEQYVGGTTESSDIYSLGATMYYVLTGHVPPESPMRAVGNVLVPPRSINPAISANTENVILIAINLQMNQRYTSAGALERAL